MSYEASGFADLQAAWADALVRALVRGGVRRIVVSPGSRSTPVVLAVARRETAGDVDVSVVIDERTAGFLALGHARATGEAALLVCTSGTAGAHYLPAVVEAAEARVPLLVLTADRPPELQGRGASQTTDQLGLLAGFVRRSFPLGPAEAGASQLRGLVETAALAVHATRWPEPGPVHINAAFRKPLEPTAASAAPDDAPDAAPLARRVEEALGGQPVIDLPLVRPAAEAIERVAEMLAASRRPLLLLGPSAPYDAPSTAAVAGFLEAAGIPVAAETTSQHRFGFLEPARACDVFEPLFGSAAFRERGAPDFVLQVAGAPTGRNLGAWIGSSRVTRCILARHGVPEAFNQAARVVPGDLSVALDALSARVVGHPSRDAGAWAAWSAELAAWSSRAAELVELDAQTVPGGRAAGARSTPVIRAIVEALPPGGCLVVGNSLPVRDFDLHARQSARNVEVLSQRGAAGIDGLLAGAAGSARPDRPTVVVVGDVSFQHDVGSLAVLAEARGPLAVVVLDNGGGRLFDLLPVRELDGLDAVFEKYFVTRPSLDVAAATRAFGVTAARPTSADRLRSELGAALVGPGAVVLHVDVDPRDALAVRRVTAALDRELVSNAACFPA